MERDILIYLQNSFTDITFTKKDKDSLLGILLPKIYKIYEILQKDKNKKFIKLDDRFYIIFENIFNIKNYTKNDSKKGGFIKTKYIKHKTNKLELDIYENNNLLDYLNTTSSTEFKISKHILYIIYNYIEIYKKLFKFNVKSFSISDINKSSTINPYLKEYIKNINLKSSPNENIVNTRPFYNQLFQIYLKSISKKNYINDIVLNIDTITKILNKDALYYLFIICKQKILYINNNLKSNKILLCHLIIYGIYSLEISFRNIKFININEKAIHFLIKILIILSIIISKTVCVDN
jgi:hypothetical protein